MVVNRMVMINIFAILSIISCKSDMKINKQISYVDIDSLAISRHLQEYYENNLLGTDFEFAYGVNIYNIDNHKVIEIFYERNLYKIYHKPPQFYSEYKDCVVLIYSEILKSETKYEKDTVLERAFPKQYEYYLKEEDFPMPVLFTRPKWKYIDGILVEKIVY